MHHAQEGPSIELRRLGVDADAELLQGVLERAPRYALLTTGQPPQPGDAAEEFANLPPGKSAADKFLFAIHCAGAVVGCADVLRGYPTDSVAFVGLLLIVEDRQGEGLGSRAYQQLEAHCASWPGIRTLRLAVVETNNGVVPFWQRMGFVATGEHRPFELGLVKTRALLFEKQLPLPAS